MLIFFKQDAYLTPSITKMFPNQLTKLAPTQNILPELLKNYFI